MEENWSVLTSLFPEGWEHMALKSGAVERFRALRSSEVLLRMILLHVATGHSLRETAVEAKLANWADISDVALLKRLRNSEEWLRSLCTELLKENCGWLLKETVGGWPTLPSLPLPEAAPPLRSWQGWEFSWKRDRRNVP